MRTRLKPDVLRACALALVLATAGVSAQGNGANESDAGQASNGGWSGYGPGMMAPGYGMGRGYGPGMGRNMTPEQRQQHRQFMREQGYQPGMGRQMSPAQRQQHWEEMRRQGYGPGMMGPGRGMMGPGQGMMGPGRGMMGPGQGMMGPASGDPYRGNNGY
jgi:hypothetical protein